MVVEHTFVTTMDGQQALMAASQLLQARGFQVMNNNAFQIGGWSDLEVRRGRNSAARAKDATQCPQQVRLEFDRGRVNVAASITPSNRRGRAFVWSGIVAGQAYSLSNAPKKQRVYADLMMVITRAVEAHLAGQMPPVQAMQEWRAVETQMIADARRARRRSLIIGIVIILLFIGLIVTIAIVANSNR